MPATRANVGTAGVAPVVHLRLGAAADQVKTTGAWLAVQQSKVAWQAGLPECHCDWFGMLAALPTAGAAGSAGAIEAALSPDMAYQCESTAEGYLNHVPKAQIIRAPRAAGPELAGGGINAMKDALGTVAASRLASTRWLPEPLRRSPD